MEKPIEHCPMCVKDKRVFCLRDVDAKCLECGQNFCGAHIGQHLKEVHCITLDLKHCSKGGEK